MAVVTGASSGLGANFAQRLGERGHNLVPADRDRADSRWTGTGLVSTTRYGTPIEPRNFTRSFDRRITKARSPGSQCMTRARRADRS